jgi:predicted NBD/HSP70 family sugar kinase
MLINVSDIRNRNRVLVLQHIQSGAARSRTALAKSLGLSLMAITRIVRELIDVQLVEEGERTARPNSPGRRRTDLALNPTGAYVIGVSLSAYSQSVTLVNMLGNVVVREPVKLSALNDPTRSIAECCDAVRQLIVGVNRRRVLGIGVAVAGTVDSVHGTLIESPFLGWPKVDIADQFARRLRIPTVVEHISKALLLAEVRFGVAQGKQNVLLFRNASAVGGSFFLDGRLVRGAHLQAGNVGHMPMRGSRRPCSCGGTGCLDTVASGWAVLAHLGRATAQDVSPETYRRIRSGLDQVLTEAARGDDSAKGALHRAGRWFGEAVLTLQAALDPELVLMAGPLGRAPAYFNGVQAVVMRASAAARCRLAVSRIEDHRAAAFHALSELVFSPRLDIQRLRPAEPSGEAKVA